MKEREMRVSQRASHRTQYTNVAAHCVRHEKMNVAGISLISLIITIIVIIILAAIVIFSGLNTPDRANFAKFTSEFSDFRTAVQQDYMQKKMKYATEGKTRSDAQIYYSIAMGTDIVEEGDINKEPTVANKNEAQYSSGTIKYISGEGEDALNLGGMGIQGTYAYLISDDTLVDGWKQDKKYYAPDETHWITDEGDVFVLPGYRIEQDGEEQWHYNERAYSGTNAGNGGASVDNSGNGTSTSSVSLSFNKIANPKSGDEITATFNGITEKYYVAFVDTSSNKAILLTKYYLSTTPSGDGNYYQQNASYTTTGIAFDTATSGEGYWHTNQVSYSDFSESGDFGYDVNGISGERAQVVNIAKAYGNNRGVMSRLMTAPEARDLGMTDQLNQTNISLDYLKGIDSTDGLMVWWLGSARSEKLLFYVNGFAGAMNLKEFYQPYYGIRPVIEVALSDIQL